MVRAVSQDGSFTTLSFTIQLGDVDEFDVSVPIDANVAVNQVNENATNGTLVAITALAFDGDGTTNTIVYTLDNSVGGRFAIDSVSGVVTVANGIGLNYEANDRHTITIRATSQDGSFSTIDMLINVIDVNEKPVGVADNYATSFIDRLIVQASGLLGNDSDVDGDGLSVLLVSGPNVGSLELRSDGSFIYTPQPNFIGIASFTYRVSDGLLDSDDITVSILVSVPNNLPGGGGSGGGDNGNGGGGNGDGGSGGSGDGGTGGDSTGGDGPSEPPCQLLQLLLAQIQRRSRRLRLRAQQEHQWEGWFRRFGDLMRISKRVKTFSLCLAKGPLKSSREVLRVHRSSAR